MENIVFWGGYTTHIFELSLAMARKWYNVKVIRNTQNEKRTERIPQAEYTNVAIIECNDNATALRICKKYDKGKTLHIQFIYVTGKTDNYPIMSSRGEFVFVGAIDKRKNIIPVVKLLQRKYANFNKVC